MERILVTGGSGFIGSHVVAALRESGYAIHVAGRRDPKIPGVVFHELDLLAPGERMKTVADAKATHLLHLAWDVIGEHLNSARHLDWIGPSIVLLKAFVESGGRRALCAGTAVEYALGPEPLDEMRTPCWPATLYGVAKDATRRAWETYAAATGTSVAWARLFHTYGPGDQPGRLTYDATRCLLTGRRFRASDGMQRCDFSHVSDVAAALVALVASDVCGPVNVGSGRTTSVRAVLERIGEITGSAQLVEFGARPLRPHDVPVIEASIERLVKEVGYRPRIDVDSGLADTVEWHRRDLSRRAASPVMAS